MAMGAVAVASGLVPGPGGTYIGGSGGSDSGVRANGVPDLETQGVTESPADRGNTSTSRDQDRATPSTSPGESRSGTPSDAAAQPDRDQADGKEPGRTSPPSQTSEATEEESAPPSSTPPSPEAPATPSDEPSRQSDTPVTPEATGTERAAEATVLTLVNEQRAKVGCSPLNSDPQLDKLAQGFSDDMAREGFFSHIAPDGSSPWDRANALGIENLAAENIARGQTDAESVVQAWMESPGHRANILNCDYRTLGVGVRFGEDGGPWWTQNFGF